MSAPKGNQNAVGHDGSNAGRKSLAKEWAEAHLLNDIWTGKVTQDELTKIISSKEHGAFHVFAAKCMTGDMRALNKLLDKLFANKQEQKITFGKEEEIDQSLDSIQELIKQGQDEQYSPQNNTDIVSSGKETSSNTTKI